ncbi:signal recognition particle receptor subunit beta-like [Hydractinia symbiolongicarpus]|uniref:signal recognition particle receptor subunit beta-like n=1 Tax=Hydractinia symbiolongicarpus TaxID=13093 RepID=UPI00254E49B6|nr:signal recognition particle receptor subunit beta-like [Hydractinia symbiolongicarpus]
MDVNLFIQQIQEVSLQSTNVYIAIAIVLVTSLLLWVVVRSSVSGDTILLLGLCDSGKTLLFSLLTTKKIIATQTSIKENKGKCVAISGKVGKSWNVVDVPGHERVRAKHLHQNKDRARGVIFLIDSVNFPREIRDVAEYIYDIMVIRTMQKNKASILIACNKQDMTTAKSCNVIKVQLEKELNNLRQTRSAALLGIDDYSSSKNAFIGKQGKDFEFAHVHPIKVDFCECSLKDEHGEKSNLDEIQAWLSAL